jgi:phage terminase large subunit-like protein
VRVPRPERPTGQLEELAYRRAEALFAAAYPDGDVGRWGASKKSKHPLGYWYDPVSAERPVIFIETLCCHAKGEWAGKAFTLEEWQKFSLRQVFGWLRPDGTRLYRVVFIEIPRKNGKTLEAAGVGLYLLVADGEHGAEIYSAATKKDQAKLVHDAAIAMVRASAQLKRYVRIYRNNLHCSRMGSKFEPLGADSNTLDGLNPSAAIVDELHAHKDRSVLDVLDTGMGARRQPLLWEITTAGLYDPESIGWLQHEHARQVLQGALEDDAFFAFVAAADPGDDWSKPATWQKANPNLGISVKADYLARQCRKAEQQASFRNTFLRYHLNLWTEQKDTWLPIETWNAGDVVCSRLQMAEREAALAGEVCYAGLDLASKVDIAALVLAFVRPDTSIDLVCRFWVPEERILERARKDRVPYDAWRRDGWLLATSGNVIDYDVIKTEALALAGMHKLQEIAFDPWNATQIATQLAGEGLTMVETRQGFRTLSEPSKNFEGLVREKKLRHGGHPVLRWMVANAAIRADENDNIAPSKRSSADRIDGVVATIMALSRALVHGARPSIYETRGAIELG